ncbi:MAG: protein translocase subunit SecD [Candidatus Latescibacterota bacterium]
MRRSTLWKIALTLVAIAASIWYLYPTFKYYTASEQRREKFSSEEMDRLKSDAVRLGLDLQGGMHMVLEVDLSKLPPDEARDAVDRAMEIITNRVDQFGVSEPVIQRQGERRIIAELPGLKDSQRATDLIGQTAQLEFKLLKEKESLGALLTKADQALADPDAAKKVEEDKEAAEQLFEEADQDSMSLQRPFTSLLKSFYTGDLCVRVKEVSRFKELLSDTRITALIPSDAQFLWANKPETMNGEDYLLLYYVRKQPEMTGAVVDDATPTVGSGFDVQTAGKPIVNFSVSDQGRKVFSRITGANVGRRLAIVLDGKVYSAPTIQTKIRDGRSIITGSKSMEEATDLCIVLRAGALPAPVKIVSKQLVGPSLGADSIRMGVRAALIGLAIAVVFMGIYYRFAGLLADAALGLNLMFMAAVLAGFHATLTLPGIAGIILTIGMAVDANVLIFERIREELRTGKTVRAAIDSGYARAFRTILDSNVTTLITAVVLYQFGTGPIRGFALTLSIGIIVSMFTALIMTRAVFDFVTDRWSIQNLSIGKSLFKDPGIRFVDVRRWAFLGSTGIIVLGLFSLGIHRGPNLSIDFEGGTLLEMHFDPAISVAEVRDALSKVDVEGKTVDLSRSEIKQFGNPNDILVRIERAGENEAAVSSAVKTTLHQAFPEHTKDQETWLRREVDVGPKIGEELKGKAIWAIIWAMAGILIYITWRFEFRFAVAAIVALLHDVVITVGVFSLLDREISLAVVAALLTIVGYSLNDTIVIFDRIREDLRVFRREAYPEIINRSINETLNRTLITSLTTLVAVLALLILGGEVIGDFALALLLGVVVGTYSSIYVASPILVEWHARTEQRDREHRAAK